MVGKHNYDIITYTVIVSTNIFLLVFWCCNELIKGWCDDLKGNVTED